MKIWLDIDNPPQVQYLLPFRDAFRDAGAEVVVTARDYGDTVAMLEAAGVDAHVFGTRTGRGMARKGAALARRVWDLNRFFARTGRPDALLAASRPAAVTARRLGIPSYIIGDYEHANVSVYRFTRSVILHPDVVDPRAFTDRGMRPDRVQAFRGLKEDLSFAGVDVDAIPPADIGPVPDDAVRVLFRPPSETSHYYSEASSSLAAATLRHLADQGALVVFSPREREQVRMLEGLPWAHEPIVLQRPLPFIALLKSVDAVVCAGGTMLREAAYLGIPAYSIFQSLPAAVDRELERLGRAVVIGGVEGLPRLQPVRRDGPLERLDSNPRLLDELAELVMAGAGGAPRRAPAGAAAV
ncbi:MAG TPA: DUF354 domain-containing protein [Baekduia sp.]|nr:DUF354 domain-containing protein [Baekduia sp.]